MNRRRTDGDETWKRLLDWTKGQKPSQRLAALILKVEGFKSVDPIHPLGGRDGNKDILAIKGGLKWIAGVYFPKGQQSFTMFQQKFKNDLKGLAANNVNGFVFVTNQEIRLSERKKLERLASPNPIEIFHLERIQSLLDTPANYGIRLEFLDIEIAKEELISFFDRLNEIVYQQSNQTVLVEDGKIKKWFWINEAGQADEIPDQLSFEFLSREKGILKLKLEDLDLSNNVLPSIINATPLHNDNRDLFISYNNRLYYLSGLTWVFKLAKLNNVKFIGLRNFSDWEKDGRQWIQQITEGDFDIQIGS